MAAGSELRRRACAPLQAVRGADEAHDGHERLSVVENLRERLLTALVNVWSCAARLARKAMLKGRAEMCLCVVR